MSELEKLTIQMDALPKGYISNKTIHGNKYFYLQEVVNGKLVSHYIPKKDLKSLKEKLKLRKELEKQIKDIQKGTKRFPIVGKLAKELTGYLMSGDKVVGEFSNGRMIRKDDQLCPLYLKRGGDLREFLASRVIDSSRTNARLLKKELGISAPDDTFLALYSHGAVLTDNYWFKSKHSKLMYSDIVFTNDAYNEIALNGDMSFLPKTHQYSPQLSLTGSYEKCWKKIDGIWWLYKKGNEFELFSELLSSQIAYHLGLDTVRYEYIDKCVRTKNFANDTNFEPMTSIAGEDDGYEHVFNCLSAISKKAASSYLKLIWFDSIVNNIDRHNENCGLLRSRADGRILGLAPNFDDNLSLIARGLSLQLDPAKDGFIAFFTKFIKTNQEAKKEIKAMELPRLTRGIIDNSLSEVPIKISNSEEISTYILKRYEFLDLFISNL